MQKLSDIASEVVYDFVHDWRDANCYTVQLIKMGITLGQLRHNAGCLKNWKLYFRMKFNNDDPTWVKEYVDEFLYKNWDAYNTRYFRVNAVNFYVLFDVAI